jgi:hypothetical protein
MAVVIKPPNPIDIPAGKQSVFLAGSIDLGVARDWQAEFESELSDCDVVILNPRREEWDDSWPQTPEFEPFREQVNWELQGQEMATVIPMFFAPGTKSPVTMLELGLFAQTGKVIACAPDGFWRKGNVDIVCQRYGVESASTFDELIAQTRNRLAK